MSNSIHYLKARNSDFLAGTDLEIFELEGKSKILTVKNVEYKENFKVNGRVKPKGMVMYFEEEYAKPLIVNTTNSIFIKEVTGVIDAKKWIGFSVDFIFDISVEMQISKTETRKGGIRIKSVNTNGLIAPLHLRPDIQVCLHVLRVEAKRDALESLVVGGIQLGLRFPRQRRPRALIEQQL